MAEQGSLFPSELPPDWIINCQQCGKPIVVQRHLPDGRIESEYRNAGRCYDCCFPKKAGAK